MKKHDKKTSELKITIKADKTEWAKAVKKEHDKLLKNVSVKGFRKGSVPNDIAKKHVSDQDSWAKAMPKMLDSLVKLASEEIEKEQIIAGPNYAVDKITASELEVTFIYPLFPEFDLSDYKKHGIKYSVDKIDDSVIDNDIEQLRQRHSILKKKDGVIKKGDVVSFDFEGSVDGKLFDGGKAENYQLEIGSGQFIAGFEDQMVGMKNNDTKDIKVTFPEEYHVDNLKGKPAIFKIKINDIQTKELPKVNDDLVAEAKIPGVKTVDELKSYIRDLLEKQATQNARGKFQREVFTKLLDGITIPLPGQLIGQEMEAQKKQFEEKLKQQGMDIKKHLEMTKMKPEQLMSQFKENAESRLKTAFVFAKISKNEKIELVDEDYDKEYEKLAVVYGQTVDAVKGTITKQQMQVHMINDRVIDILIKSSK